jgi:hypothetical protein
MINEEYIKLTPSNLFDLIKEIMNIKIENEK